MLADTHIGAGKQILTASTNSRVNHDNVVLVVVVEIVYQFTHLLQWISRWVIGKHPSPVHVVDIVPHGFQGDAGLAVVVNNFSTLVDISVAVFAVVELLCG